MARSKIQGKPLLIATIIVAGAYVGLDYLVHECWLKDDYLASAELWRPVAAMQSKMWVGFLGYFFFGLLATVMYGYGFEEGKPPTTQGIRFGILLGLIFWGAGLALNYPYIPWPDALYLKWFMCGFGEFIILGLILGAVYRPKT